MRTPERMLDCAQRAGSRAGLQELVVHARTKRQGYKPPALLGTRSGASRAAIACARGCQRRDLERALTRCRRAVPRVAAARPDAGPRRRGRSQPCPWPCAPTTWACPPRQRAWGLNCRRPRCSVIGQRVRQAGGRASHQAGRVKQWLHYLAPQPPRGRGSLHRDLRTIHEAPQDFDAALNAALLPRLATAEPADSPDSPRLPLFAAKRRNALVQDKHLAARAPELMHELVHSGRGQIGKAELPDS